MSFDIFLKLNSNLGFSLIFPFLKFFNTIAFHLSFINLTGAGETRRRRLSSVLDVVVGKRGRHLRIAESSWTRRERSTSTLTRSLLNRTTKLHTKSPLRNQHSIDIVILRAPRLWSSPALLHLRLSGSDPLLRQSTNL